MNTTAVGTTTTHKIDGRGLHWQHKAIKPMVWKNTKFWAEEHRKLEQEVLSTTPIKTFPWQLANTRAVGNQAKYIWMLLFLYDHKKIVRVDWVLNADVPSFFGITGFTVLDPETFNGGFFPLPSAWREGMLFLKKTLIHNWHAVGMIEVPNANRMRFDQHFRDMIRRQRLRMDEKRHTKAKVVSAETPADTSPTTAQMLATPLELLSRIAAHQYLNQAALAVARENVHRAQADVEAASAELHRAKVRSALAFNTLQTAHAQLAKAQLDAQCVGPHHQ